MKNVVTIRKNTENFARPNMTSNSFCNNCQLALISELWAYAIVLTIFPTQIYIRRGCLICFTQEYRPSHIFFLRGIYDPLRLAIFCKKKIRLVSNSRFSTRRQEVKDIDAICSGTSLLPQCLAQLTQPYSICKPQLGLIQNKVAFDFHKPYFSRKIVKCCVS